jgi:predicted HTH transcriptional regulator
MSPARKGGKMISDEKLIQIVNGFIENQTELEHVEFKHNWHGEIEFAQDVCAITNLLLRKSIARGYIIFGIDDESHEIVGTDFHYQTKRIKNKNKPSSQGEEIELWISHNIYPKPNLEFRGIQILGKWVTVVIISQCVEEISEFDNTAYIRIGTNTKKLKEYPAIRKELYSKVVSVSFEQNPALCNISLKDIESLLDLESFVKLRTIKSPVEHDRIIDTLLADKYITDNFDSTYNITNLGALLLARDLSKFGNLHLFAPKVVVYEDDFSQQIKTSQTESRGFGIGFEGLYNYILSSLKTGEVIEGALRRPIYKYPEITIRELLANMLVHQDFSVDSVRPTVEVFSNRIVFTNSGQPIVPTERFVDSPSARRNMSLAGGLCLLGVCEELGSGWKKVAHDMNEFQFPAPLITKSELSTTITLKDKVSLNDLSKEDKVFSVFIHVVIQHCDNIPATNSTIRKRFNISPNNAATASKLLNDCLDANLIKIFDEEVGPKGRRYVPFWVGCDNA